MSSAARGHRQWSRFWPFRKRSDTVAPLDRDKLIAELIAEGWLEQEFRLTDKSRELLAADPVEMDDYTYWCVHSRARYAYALAEGYSLTAAGIGGPWRREGERSHKTW